MARMIDWIARHGRSNAELKAGPLTPDRASSLRVRLLARAGLYGGGGGDSAAAAVAPTDDELEDAIFHQATEVMQREQLAPGVAVDRVLTALLSELAAGARL